MYGTNQLIASNLIASLYEKVIPALVNSAEKIEKDIRRLKKNHPGKSTEWYANRLISHKIWKATASGILSGLPSNPVTALPAAALDTFYVTRNALVGTALLGELYFPGFMRSDTISETLFIIVFLVGAGLEKASKGALMVAKQGTKQLIKKYISKDTLKFGTKNGGEVVRQEDHPESYH